MLDVRRSDQRASGAMRGRGGIRRMRMGEGCYCYPLRRAGVSHCHWLETLVRLAGRCPRPLERLSCRGSSRSSRAAQRRASECQKRRSQVCIVWPPEIEGQVPPSSPPFVPPRFSEIQTRYAADRLEVRKTTPKPAHTICPAIAQTHARRLRIDRDSRHHQGSRALHNAQRIRRDGRT